MELRKEFVFGKYKNAPSFSREKWNEVYKDAFSTKYEDWIKAQSHLETWKNRVPESRLHTVISCTLDLVHAQLVLCNAYGSQDLLFRGLDECFKNDLFNHYIASFVTTATKRLEVQLEKAKKMNAVAKEINLPEYMVDLRNNLIHKKTDYIFPDTKKHYLEVAQDWIKKHWEEIAEEEESRQKKLKKNSSEVKSKKLKAYIARRVTLIITHCKGFKYDNKEKKIISRLNEALSEYASEYPEDAMKILAEDLFFAPQVINRMKKSTKMYHSPHCKLKSHSIQFIFKLTVSHLLTVIKINAINDFINALIEQGTNCPETASGWIRVMANLTREDTKEGKIFLKATKLRNLSFSKKMRWKEQHLYTLFTSNETWANDLGLELCKENLLNVSKDYQKLLMEHVSTNKRDRDCNNASKLEVDPKMSAEKCTPDVERAREVSPGVSGYLLVRGNRIKGRKTREKVVPLGVLPHEVGDECLPKVLRPPHSDSSTRNNCS